MGKKMTKKKNFMKNNEMNKTGKNIEEGKMKNENRKSKKNERNPKIVGKASREILRKKIGKAQKGKKHKKIKAIDPFYSGDRKNFISNANLLNRAPKTDDEEQFPGKLKEILRLKEEMKSRKNENKILDKKEFNQKGSSEMNVSKKTYIPVPSSGTSWPKPIRKTCRSNEEEEEKPLFIPEGQREGEKPVQYLRRINRELSNVVEKTMLFQKYGIDFTDMNSGKMEKLYGMNEKNRQRLKEMAKEKKKRKLEKLDKHRSGFEHLEDNVEFGEVVMSPPDKLAKPRHADPSKLLKPGSKELLLKNLVNPDNSQKPKENPNSKTPNSSNPPKKKKDKFSLKKTTKLKHLPPVKQTILNNERERVVQLYREMKKNKRHEEK